MQESPVQNWLQFKQQWLHFIHSDIRTEKGNTGGHSVINKTSERQQFEELNSNMMHVVVNYAKLHGFFLYKLYIRTGLCFKNQEPCLNKTIDIKQQCSG